MALFLLMWVVILSLFWMPPLMRSIPLHAARLVMGSVVLLSIGAFVLSQVHMVITHDQVPMGPAIAWFMSMWLVFTTWLGWRQKRRMTQHTKQEKTAEPQARPDNS